MVAYRHGAKHLHKRAKRATIARKRRHNRRDFPPFCHALTYSGWYFSRTGTRRYYTGPQATVYYLATEVPGSGREKIIYDAHRVPYKMHRSSSYDVPSMYQDQREAEEVALFRTKQAAINGAWRVYHQDEDWQAAVISRGISI